MKFYNSVGPNPRVVKLFMAEKGIEMPEVSVDLRGGENRRAPYNVDVNPAGQTPALELDDGSFLSEITAICEYLEERFPETPLIGTTAEERANTRMWTRRIDRSEEHTSELQSLMRTSYAVLCSNIKNSTHLVTSLLNMR